MKIGQERLDTAAQAFFARELEQVMAEVFRQDYPEIVARDVFPFTSRLNAGAQTWSYKSYDKTGEAKILANGGKDIPRVGLKATETTGVSRLIAVGYGYTYDDIRAAMFAGVPLDTELAMIAKETALRKENSIAFSGDSTYGLNGLFTDANIPSAAVTADGSGATTSWANKTGEQIVRDIGLAKATIGTLTKQVESPNACIMAASSYNLLSYTFIPNTTMTVLNFIKSNYPEITYWRGLNELESSGTGSTKEFILYRRDPMKIRLECPMDFTQYQPREVGLAYEVDCEMKSAGLIVPKPLSVSRNYGI